MTWRFVCWIAKPLYIWWLFVQVLHRSKKDGKQYAIKVQENRIELCLGSLYQVTDHELSSTLILVFDIFSMFKCSSKSMKSSPVMAIISCDYFLSSCKSRSNLPIVGIANTWNSICAWQLSMWPIHGPTICNEMEELGPHYLYQTKVSVKVSVTSDNGWRQNRFKMLILRWNYYLTSYWHWSLAYSNNCCFVLCLLYTYDIHCQELMNSLWCHCSLSLLIMLKVMVWQFMSDTHKAMTALILVVLQSKCYCGVFCVIWLIPFCLFLADVSQVSAQKITCFTHWNCNDGCPTRGENTSLYQHLIGY